jgi:TPR repeat protein
MRALLLISLISWAWCGEAGPRVELCPSHQPRVAERAHLSATILPGEEWVEVWGKPDPLAEWALLFSVGETPPDAEWLMEGLPPGSALRCAGGSGRPDCDVKLTSATLVNETTVQLGFSSETDMPRVDSAEDILGLVTIGVAGVDKSALAARWETPSLLSVVFRGQVQEDEEFESADGGSVVLVAAPRRTLLRQAWERRYEQALTSFERETARLNMRLMAPLVVTAVVCGPPEEEDAQAGPWCAGGRELSEPLEAEWTVQSGETCEGITESVEDDLILVPARVWGQGASVAERRQQVVPGPGLSRLYQVKELFVSDQRPSVAALPEAPASEFELGAAFSPRGVMSVGARGWRVPTQALPLTARSHGNWSMCMWVWLDETPSAELQRWRASVGSRGVAAHNVPYRTLFLKGSGRDQQRTPSAWLRPEDNSLLLGLSLAEDPAATAETSSRIPPLEWTHVCFSLSNFTQGASNESLPSPTFQLSVHVNGGADQVLEVARTVAWSNPGGIWIGRDPSFSGTRMLIAGFRLFDSALSSDQVKRLFDAMAPAARWADAIATDTVQPELHEGAPFSTRADTAGWLKSELHTFVGVASAAQASRRSLLAQADASTHSRVFREAEAAEMTDRALGMLSDCSLEASVAIDLLEDSCEDGRGDPDGCFALAQWVAQPGRPQCHQEVEAAAAASRDHMSLARPQDRDDGFSLVRWDPERGPEGRGAALVRDVPRARQLLERAASRGHCGALYKLGMWETTGVGSNDTAMSRELDRIGQYLAGKTAPPRATLHSFDALTPFATGPFSVDAEFSTIASGAQARATVGMGLLHLAAGCGHPPSWHALGVRYAKGVGGVRQRDAVTASVFLDWSSGESETAYTTQGQEPLHEMHRLTPETVDRVVQAEGGNDDAAIEQERNRAEQGDIGALMTMGHLTYWGARGVERDHVRARGYFRRAAELGSVDGKSACAGMLLKGEGGEVDNSTGLRYYEEAAEAGHIGALNGLGYAYFNGQGTEVNRTRARELFCRSMELGGGGDATFNCARCLEMGDEANGGNPPRPAQARVLFYEGSRRFGHFLCSLRAGWGLARGGDVDPEHDGALPETVLRAAQQYSPSITSLDAARSVLEGSAVLLPWAPWDAEAAIGFLHRTSDYGPWASLLRSGFDRYRLRDYDGALLHYLEAWALGYELGASNAAYLVHRRLANILTIAGHRASVTPVAADALALRGYHWSYSSGVDSSAGPLGELVLFGRGGVPPDDVAAAAFLARAAASGSPWAAFRLASLYEAGGRSLPPNEDRALRYLQRVLDIAPGSGHEAPVYFALSRIHVRRMLRDTHWLPSWLAAPALSSTPQDYLSEWAHWSLDLRGKTESPARDAHELVNTKTTRGDVEDQDEESALGGYDAQATSLWWVVRRVWPDLHIGVRAALAVTALVMVLAIARLTWAVASACWGAYKRAVARRETREE